MASQDWVLSLPEPSRMSGTCTCIVRIRFRLYWKRVRVRVRVQCLRCGRKMYWYPNQTEPKRTTITIFKTMAIVAQRMYSASRPPAKQPQQRHTPCTSKPTKHRGTTQLHIPTARWQLKHSIKTRKTNQALCKKDWRGSKTVSSV